MAAAPIRSNGVISCFPGHPGFRPTCSAWPDGRAGDGQVRHTSCGTRLKGKGPGPDSLRCAVDQAQTAGHHREKAMKPPGMPAREACQ
jgi:hypothetical protein